MVVLELPSEAEDLIQQRSASLVQKLQDAGARGSVFSGGIVDNMAEHCVEVDGISYFLKIVEDKLAAAYEMEQLQRVSGTRVAICYGSRLIDGWTVIILEYLAPLNWSEPADQLVSCAQLVLDIYTEEEDFLTQDVKVAHFGKAPSGWVSMF